MGFYRKKPVVVEAVQYIIIKEITCKYGIHKETNSMEIAQFMGRVTRERHMPDGNPEGRRCIEIETLEGVMQANLGDFIIKDINNEFYPCKPDMFELTYEPTERE